MHTFSIFLSIIKINSLLLFWKLYKKDFTKNLYSVKSFFNAESTRISFKIFGISAHIQF